MSYGKFTVGTRIYDLSHLDPFTLSIVVHGTIVEVDVMFSFHLFTDQKGRGRGFHITPKNATSAWTATS